MISLGVFLNALLLIGIVVCQVIVLFNTNARRDYWSDACNDGNHKAQSIVNGLIATSLVLQVLPMIELVWVAISGPPTAGIVTESKSFWKFMAVFVSSVSFLLLVVAVGILGVFQNSDFVKPPSDCTTNLPSGFTVVSSDQYASFWSGAFTAVVIGCVLMFLRIAGAHIRPTFGAAYDVAGSSNLYDTVAGTAAAVETSTVNAVPSLSALRR